MRNFVSILGAFAAPFLIATPSMALDLHAAHGPTLLVLPADEPSETIDMITTVSIGAVRSFAYATESVGLGFPADTDLLVQNPPLPTPRPRAGATDGRVTVDRPARTVRPVASTTPRPRPVVIRISSPLSPIIGAFN